MRDFIIASVLCSPLAACSHPANPKVQERLEYWRMSLAHDIPPGTMASGAQEWFRTRHIKISFLEEQRWLYANAESVPDPSPVPFPFSAWNIIIKITIDANDRTVENDISSVGSCL